jgi:hypothetical protein
MFHLHASSQAGTIQKCPLLQDKNQRDLKNKKFALILQLKGTVSLDFKNFDENLQNMAQLRDAAGF